MHTQRAVLISTYDLGRQPFGLASPTAWLRAAGWDVTQVDLAKERLNDEVLAAARLVAFHLPMHTATRLAEPVIVHARRLNPAARLCAYGLYAPLNESWLRSLGVDDVLGGEFEEDLTAIARALASDDASTPAGRTPGRLPRIHFMVPDRAGLPRLDQYARLQLGDGSRKVVGYTEASRGCRHLCGHCPIVPVYAGQFRIVQPDVVLADVAVHVAAGAEHVTFGDPDFFNGPTHAMRIVDEMHASYPSLTYDVTIKVEHLLRHRTLLPRLRDTGCLFVTSAVESIDDGVLARLGKGHSRQDFVEVVALFREAGLTLVPTFVAFHPWLALEGYAELLDTIAELELVDHVSPIQLAVRLLVPEGSKLLDLDEVRSLVGPFDPATLTYRWSHPDPRVDELHKEIAAIVGSRLAADRRETFQEVSVLAHARANLPLGPAKPVGERVHVPFLTEPWYCCAEPSPDQLRWAEGALVQSR